MEARRGTHHTARDRKPSCFLANGMDVCCSDMNGFAYRFVNEALVESAPHSK